MYTLIKKFIKKLRPQQPVLYKIGNVKRHNSLIDSLTPNMVEIGDNFVSAPGSIVLAHDASIYFHSGMYRIQKTILGNNVFLGANATILPGVRVGDNVIIGAGAVVTKDVESGMVVCGNPAKTQCTVEEYVDKCKKSNIAIKAPEGFVKIFLNETIEDNDRLDLQSAAEMHYKQI